MEGTLSIGDCVYCLREKEEKHEVLIFVRELIKNKSFPNLEIPLEILM